jgi:hypothetical protein
LISNLVPPVDNILHKESHSNQVNSNEQFPKQSFNFNNRDLTATDFTFEPCSLLNQNSFKDPFQSNFDATNVFFNEKNTYIESQYQVFIIFNIY